MVAQREAMTSVDQAWLRMDRDDNLMMICAVLVLDKLPDVARLRQVIETRLLAWDRFSQRVVRQGRRAWWEPDPHFHLDNHIHQIGLGRETGRDGLARLAGDLASTPLDARHPLWTLHLVDDYGEGAAVIVRMHHCIADGLALVRVLLALTDEHADAGPEPAPAPQSGESGLWRAAQRFSEQVIHLGRGAVGQAGEIMRDPSVLAELARRGLAVGRELADIGLMPADPPGQLRGDRCGRKHVGWCDPLDLEAVRTLAHALGGTINDVLMTVAAGAVRRWLKQQGAPLTQGLHVAVPFNLRPLDRPVRVLGNQFGLVIVRLPVDRDTPLERFRAVQSHMLALKSSPQPWVFYGMLGLFGRGPEALERMALDVLSSKASLVMTNVPGPREPLYLAGARIRQPLFWVPQSGGIGLGLSILSYAGTVQFGVIADEQMVSEPESLADAFAVAFEELAAAAQPSS